MVKRQTVWLSTMMVLSLMLIGYYTMNNQASPTTTTPTTSNTTTVVTTPDTGNSAQTQSGDNQPNNSSSETGMTSTGNWYNSLQTLVNNQISQRISNYQSVIANNNASQSQIAEAQKALGNEESLYNSLQQATQAVLAEGYANAVIEPDKDQKTFTVYVQAKDISRADAVKIMNVVSQQLDVSILNISVKPHA
ncbi:hypothetical protein Alches_10010 [Alicyclobacillus hesperidum subsp. aegles]|uniref:SpoIIIAH-like family protein n=1 Tax=Alicyclobacillus hesperidum TaxID=89784 RepID=UPI00222C108E|nr:SpoIIIAH-like family protein [Alicyclobacillus hesperidum]GLG00962.1 hypothetical protein Alches_10010 [Alicyclobacillus hesperidum subsp. aegles]